MKYHISKSVLLRSIWPAIAFSLFYAVVFPLQTYVGNKDMFGFEVCDLFPVILGGFVVGLIVVYLLCVITDPILKGLVPVVFVTIAIWGYLEVGILSIGVPQIDGSLDQWNVPSLRKYVDLAVLYGLLILAVFLREILYSYMHWICLGFIVLSVASVFDANTMIDSMKATSKFESGRTVIGYDIVKSAVFSRDRNVIVISLDTMPGDIAAEILSEDDELKKKFQGFTIYKNNIAMHERTARGVPSLITGKYLQKEELANDHVESMWGGDSCFNAYLSGGYSLFINSCLGGYSNCYKFRTKTRCARVQSSNVLSEYTKDFPYITFYDVMRIRIVPYRYKLGYIRRALAAGNAVNMSVSRMEDEDEVYSALKSAEIVNGAKTMHFYHTTGAHQPITRGRNGERLIGDAISLGVIKDYMAYLMDVVGDFMDHLRKSSIYDNSMIVVTTDHGWAVKSLIPIPKFALLMVKPFGETSDFRICELPTSHSRIHDLLEKSATDDLSAGDVDSLLRQNERLWRARIESPDKWWYFGRAYDTWDFLFDEKGKEIRRTCLGRFKTS